jgi:vacuolar-type H+-ATPase subunit C/Vma6
VTPSWDDVNARARGLGTRLFSRGQLESLTRATDLAALTEGMRRLGLPVTGEREAATPAELELAVRRWAAAALRTLARWAGPRVAALAVIYEEEDRKSLRAILRGAIRGAAADSRLSGLIPTPGLPERALEELGRQPTPAAVAALLSAWRHPYGAVLAKAAGAGQPDPFALDVALDRAFAARALAAARRAGGDLLAFVRESVDLSNALTALVLAVAGRDVVPKDVFLAGGERITITVFEEAIALGEPGAAGMRLARGFAPGGGSLAEPLRHLARDFTDLEEELLRVRIRAIARRTRLSPLGPGPVLWFALRLRAQVVDLQRIVWGAALSAPRADLAAALVTAP